MMLQQALIKKFGGNAKRDMSGKHVFTLEKNMVARIVTEQEKKINIIVVAGTQLSN